MAIELDRSAWPTATLVVEKLFDVVDPGDGHAIDITDAHVIRDGAGRFYYVPLTSPFHILRISATGTVDSVIGRRGDGPVEFQRIIGLHRAPDNNIYVIDGSARRVSVLAADFRPVRSFIIDGTPIPASSAVLPDGRLVVNAIWAHANGFGLPLHVVTADGEYTGSFGAREQSFRPGDYYKTARSITPGPDGTIWSAWMNEYRVEQWSADGRAMREYTGTPDWFLPFDRYPRISDDTPPPTTIMDLTFLDERHLAILAFVPGRRWRDGYEERDGPDGPMWQLMDWAVAYDTQFEVVDIGTGAVVASRRVPEFLFRFTDRDLAVAIAQSESGEPSLSVWQIRFQH